MSGPWGTGSSMVFYPLILNLQLDTGRDGQAEALSVWLGVERCTWSNILCQTSFFMIVAQYSIISVLILRGIHPIPVLFCKVVATTNLLLCRYISMIAIVFAAVSFDTSA